MIAVYIILAVLATALIVAGIAGLVVETRALRQLERDNPRAKALGTGDIADARRSEPADPAEPRRLAITTHQHEVEEV